MTIFSPVQAHKFRLAGAGITSSATTIVLQSFKTPVGTEIVTTDIGSIGYLVLEPGTSREEVISFTTITQSSTDDTATLTGVTRGLGFTTPYTTVSANQFAHAGGTIAVLSNPSAFYNKFPSKVNDEVITGYWEAPDPLTAQGIVTRDYMLALINGGTITTNALLVVGTAGETLVAGNLIYLNTADGRWWKTDADTLTTVQGVILGIAQGSGTAGVSITGGVLLKGVDSHQSGLSAGTIYYASNTAGGISSTTGTNIRTIGVANSTTAIYFDPYFVSVDSLGLKQFIYGESITVGDALYIKASDQKVYKTDAGAAGTTASFVGFATATGSANAVQYVQTQGVVTGLSGLTAGTYYWLSGTPGAISSSAGTNAYRVGLALSTTSLRIDPVSKMNSKTYVFTSLFGATATGSNTSQFDITNPSGTTFRYTYDGNGTDPTISATTVPIGTTLIIAGQNFNAANNGTFVTTGVGANYFEVTNASGVAENNKTIGTGSIKYGYAKPDGLKYVLVEVLGGGASGGNSAAAVGGGSGCYAKGFIQASALGTTETLTIGPGGGVAGNEFGIATSLGALVIAGGGGVGGNIDTGGVLTGSAVTGFLVCSTNGGAGYTRTGFTPDLLAGGAGGDSPYGKGGQTTIGELGTNQVGSDASGYGSGGGGAAVGAVTGGLGKGGLIFITEFF